jgi:hypothetical protein
MTLANDEPVGAAAWAVRRPGYIGPQPETTHPLNCHPERSNAIRSLNHVP